MSVPTLESIPVELHICILDTIPDIHSVWSLLRASPAYYGAFLLVKQSFLRRLLQKHHAGLVDTVDAIAAIRSKGLYASDPSNKRKIVSFLDSRPHNHRTTRPEASLSLLPDEPADVQETMQLIHLHNQAIFFLEDYCRTARRPGWIDEAKWEKEFLPLVLTETEKRRIFRAFYRLQIYGNIFGSIERNVDSEFTLEDNDWTDKQEVFTGGEMWRLFFSHMAPWEVEEFGCLWEHCCYRFESILREVSDSLMQTGFTWFHELPKDEQPPEGCWYSDCDDFVYPENKRENLASKGPAFLSRVLRQKQFRDRRDLVLVNVRSIRFHFFDFGFWPRPSATNDLHLLYPANRFNFGTDRNGLREFLKTFPPFQRPNIAWDRIWLREVYESPEVLFDMYEYGAENRQRRWQYAMWDDTRLTEWEIPIFEDNFPIWDSTLFG
ncbi:hypothetical protein BO85DRAFT_415284 [Aspergillus piperis CBS 112811]|uniref:Uncharacterized protein n=1 Tax=Aspergillus piperis CBS 112811 TaxID=1448313 RepID=A0A8G1R7R6_9EURO|nr:hypothetical protein BO85DRAFT_415284 [Aspergillus piperis CBS 112811]RAH60181.1 hypothetical protein BO85DRAFT_415284 [Aspergillus piperis CBS 112811]